MIDWMAKAAEAKRIAGLDLPGRAMDLAVVLLWHLNPEHGVAFPGADDLQVALGGASDRTVQRAIATLISAGVIGSAKRRGAAVRWFPRLMQMPPGEARRRVENLQAQWRSKNDPSKVTDHHSNDPSDARSVDPSRRPSKESDLNLPSNEQSLSGRQRRTFQSSKDDFRDAHEELKVHNAADETAAPEPQRRLVGGRER
jgi:hypothetical protein